VRRGVPQPAKARLPELAPGVNAIAAFKTIAATLLAEVQANRQGVIEGRDPEYLHQMRVAVRRLRSLCAAYAKTLPAAALQPLRAELKWLAHALGPARDADVFATEIWPPLRAALGAHPLLAQFDALWEAQRAAAASQARRALLARRYRRMVLTFERWLAGEPWRADASARQLAVLDGAARDFACRVLERRHARVRRHGRTLKHLDEPQLHALRIRVKKLRYAMDSLGSLFGRKAVRAVVARLSRLQDVLGKLNDLHVAEQHMAAAVARRRGRTVRHLRSALAAWRGARAQTLRRQLRAAWRRYRHVQVFW
jgi:CHAD domain-containing protein